MKYSIRRYNLITRKTVHAIRVEGKQIAPGLAVRDSHEGLYPWVIDHTPTGFCIGDGWSTEEQVTPVALAIAPLADWNKKVEREKGKSLFTSEKNRLKAIAIIEGKQKC